MAANAYNDWNKGKEARYQRPQNKNQADLLQQQADNRYDEMKAGFVPKL